MSNSVVPAAAVAHAKQLVKNKKLIKRTENQKPAPDEQQAVDHNPDAANAVQVEQADHAKSSMSAISMAGDFSFGGALSAAADSSASLIAESAQDDGGSVGDDGDGAGGTILLVGAVGLAGLGVAVLAGGGGKSNEAPDITSGSTATIAENSTAAVYTTVATDPDGDTLTYSLTGSDAAAFNISQTGVVTLKAPADFETKSSYSFNVVVSDGELTDTQAVTVTVTNVTGAGDPPVFTSGTTASIAENSATTTVVYDANVSGTGATFALTGADASSFTIDNATGEVRFVNSPDFETKTSYNVGVVATQGGATTTQNIVVSVTNVAEAPTLTLASTTATFAENVPTSTVVFDAGPDGTGVVFGLTGADAGSFNINPSTGVVTFKASPDFETKSSYSFGITGSRGGETSAPTNVTVTITDVALEGPTFTSGTTASIPEESPASTVVYDANTTSDANGVTFSLTGTDAGLFNINSTTGVVTFKVSPDFETDPTTYSITVRATDSVGTTSQNVTITVTDITEAPTTSIDVGSPVTTITLSAAAGDVTFSDDFTLTTNVNLTNFTEGDIILVDNIDDLDDYSFTTGSGGAVDSNDLVITANNGAGVTASIVIRDVVANAGIIFDYETAAAAVGYDFMQIA